MFNNNLSMPHPIKAFSGYVVEHSMIAFFAGRVFTCLTEQSDLLRQQLLLAIITIMFH